MGISTRTLAVCILRMVCAVSTCSTAPALAAGPLDDFAARSSVGSMFYFRLPLGPAAQSARGGTLGFMLKNELASSYTLFQKEQRSYPERATSSFNLMDLKLGMSGRFRSLTLGGLTALGTSPPNP